MIGDDLHREPDLERETLFTGRVFDIEGREFEHEGTRMRREVMVHPGAVAVLALREDRSVCLVHQYRHPAGGTLWELPAGLLDVAGEDPLDAAKRELAEEVDLVADDWRTLIDISPSGGGSTEHIRIYLARGLRDAPEAFERTDEEATMERRWVPLDEIVAAAGQLRLHNATMLVAALLADAVERRTGLNDPASTHPADTPWPWA